MLLSERLIQVHIAEVIEKKSSTRKDLKARPLEYEASAQPLCTSDLLKLIMFRAVLVV